MPAFPGKVIVAVDRTTPGSEGRLYLQLPSDLQWMVGRHFAVYGNLGDDKSILLVPKEGGKVITPRRQLWWKNGVQEHKIRENWVVNLTAYDQFAVVVNLVAPTGEPKPVLPPAQDKLF